MLAETYYSSDQPDSSLAVLDRMTLSNADDTLFHNTYYLLDTALQHGIAIHDFGETERTQIEEWINMSYPSSFIAGNIAQAAGWTEGKVSIEQWPSGKRGHQETESSTYQSSIVAYPIPFTDFVVIEFIEPVPEGSHLMVADVTGRHALSFELRALETRTVVVTSSLPSGFYLGRALCGSRLIGSVKLVKE